MSNSWEDIPGSGGGSGSNASVGTNGASSPGSSTAIGFNNAGGNLTQVSPTNPLPVDIHLDTVVVGENLSQVNGASVNVGTGASSTGTQRVAVASDSTLGVTGNVTVVQPTGTNLHAVIDSGSITANAGTGTFAVSAASLPLPAGAATSANQTTLGNQTTKINDGTNTATVKPASAPALSTDTAMVVAISPNSPLPPASDVTASGSLAALNATVSIITNGISTVGVDISGAWVGTITPEGQINGTWYQMTFVDTGGGLLGLTWTTNNLAQINTAGLQQMRVRMSAYTSGSATIKLQGSVAAGIVSLAESLPQGTNNIGSITNITGTVTLPTGAATSVLQTTISSNQTTLGSQTTKLNDGTNTAAVKAASTAPVAADPALVVAISPNSPTQSSKQVGFASSNAPVYNVYGTTPVTTGAYVQLIASTTSATNYIDIFDSSGQAMILATGAAGSEVIQAYIPPGGDAFSFAIPAGTRVAYKALTANAASGFLLMNLRG
jgi:hypothetical protein